MKKLHLFRGLLVLMLSIGAVLTANAQEGRETYTGTVLSYGTGLNTRTSTRLFQLNITNRISDSQAKNYLGVLQESGQDTLLKAIEKQDAGRFSIGPNVGVPINVVRESMVDGRMRVFVVFQRQTQFAELRGGYRSLDYPFGVIELFVDPQTGKGEGTYIAAAQIRWKDDKNGNRIEIENFATYPAKLLGVTRRR